MEWFELSEQERIKQVYSRYTIKDFWDWWSDKDEERVMEVRIRDYKLIKEVVAKYKLPYSSSGVYIKTAEQLKTVIGMVRDKTTVWMGANARKKAYGGSKDWKTWGAGSRAGSSDDNIDSLNYIFVDIDRIVKERPANNEELKNCDILANKILEKMEKQKWSESYVKICSGNGVQLLFKLDIPIKIPTRTYNNEKKYFEHSDEFDKLKSLMKGAIGVNISQFCKRFKKDLSVEVDLSGFNMNRVCALPCSKNYKYNGFTWRGVIHIEDGTNKGLSDYILSKIDDIKTFKSKNVFVTSRATSENIIRPGKLRENTIAKLLMENELPGGQLNNTVWFQLKTLLRDSRFDMNSKEFREFHRDLEKKYNGRFTTNLPTKEFSFNENTINSFCINNGIVPIYQLWRNRTKKLNMKLEHIGWSIQEQNSEVMELDSDTTIQEDMQKVKDKLTEGDYKNIKIIAAFVNGCINKYGENKTRYFLEYLFDRYFNYS